MSVEQRNRAQGLCYLAGSARGFLRSAGAGPAQGRFSRVRGSSSLVSAQYC
jgi:hypothetical protein